MNRYLAAPALALALALPAAALQSGAMPDGLDPSAPQAHTGPYRVVIDRIMHTRSTVLNYASAAAPRETASVDGRRTVQFQFGVFADTPAAAAGLSDLQVDAVTVTGRTRPLELSHYGGVLETPDKGPIVRAYLCIPSFPASAKELRSLEGQIIAYERSEELRFDIPLEATTARTVEQNGVKAVLHNIVLGKSGARCTLSLSAPSGEVLVSTANDGTYGVSLLDQSGRPAESTGAALAQERPNKVQIRAGFEGLRAPAARVRLVILHRAGPRRAYPFRIERIEVPTRPASRTPKVKSEESQQ